MRFLQLTATACLAFAPANATAGALQRDGTTACAGEMYLVRHAKGGAAPYIRLSADGRTGNFLLDWGATQSSLSRTQFSANRGPVTVFRFSLPTFPSGVFQLRDYGAVAAPRGGRLGIIGTDFLSKMSVHLSYGTLADTLRIGGSACDPSELTRLGFRRFSQAGFFSADAARVSGPNVPILPIAIGNVTVTAQIDSGYDDVVMPHSIDINDALLQLLKKAGVPLTRGPDITVATCSGVETRQAYIAPGALLGLGVADGQPPARTVKRFRLLLKRRNGCGGIADMSVPAAQLGASFLRTLSPLVIDGKAEAVWLRP